MNDELSKSANLATDRELLNGLEPSLWNSQLGRKTFLKKTGAATVGVGIALHGFRTELLASHSSTSTCGLKNVIIHFTWTSATDETGYGYSTVSAAQALAKAYENAMDLCLANGAQAAAAGPADKDDVSKCATAIVQGAGYSSGGVAPTVTPSTSGTPTTYSCLVTIHKDNTCWLQLKYVQAQGHPTSATCVP